MNNTLNIGEILRQHKPRTVFSLYEGEVTVDSIDSIGSIMAGNRWHNPNGSVNNQGVCLLYPSRQAYEQHPLNPQKAWEEWQSSQESDICHTWEELKKRGHEGSSVQIDSSFPYQSTPEEESALALVKIRRLIDASYGGNPTFAQKHNGTNSFYFIDFDACRNASVTRGQECIDPVAFYTKEQAKRFISHPENVELLRSYYFV